MLSFNLTVVLTVFVISIVLLISNRVRYDLIGIGSVFVLMAFGITKLSTVTAEIGSLPVLLLGIVMIVSKTVSDSGIIDKFAEVVSKKIKNEYILLFALFDIRSTIEITKTVSTTVRLKDSIGNP